MSRRSNYSDAPAFVDIKESIRQLRKIYSDLSDKQFARLYAKRYKVKEAAVLKFLRKEK